MNRIQFHPPSPYFPQSDLLDASGSLSKSHEIRRIERSVSLLIGDSAKKYGIKTKGFVLSRGNGIAPELTRKTNG